MVLKRWALAAPLDTALSLSCCYIRAWQKQDSVLDTVLWIATYKKQWWPACCPGWWQGTYHFTVVSAGYFSPCKAISYKHTSILQLDRTVTIVCCGWTRCASTAKFSQCYKYQSDISLLLLMGSFHLEYQSGHAGCLLWDTNEQKCCLIRLHCSLPEFFG